MLFSLLFLLKHKINESPFESYDSLIIALIHLGEMRVEIEFIIYFSPVEVLDTQKHS
jgi:hypothetical protein